VYEAAVRKLDFHSVKADIIKVLTDSKEFWPADYGNYGPLFIRLAWHVSGSYRVSDGRGGAEGGRQRFDPERSWDDNTNLDKARRLLWPIKKKYGIGLSWGDLFVLAGTTSIESMGGPVLGFCGGRVDDNDGAASMELGPTEEQVAVAPCAVNGDCKAPLGASTMSLIYVNPEGPMGKPIPEESAPQVRDTFARMSMNDTETVALIGGGHAFGKTHGACPDGPGTKPMDDPANPWAGKCGTGKGADAFTSGFEGPWSSTPTKWTKKYFEYLDEKEWEVVTGPGGHNQWKVIGGGPSAPGAQGGEQEVMMLTSDISLLHDEKYRPIVATYAKDQSAIDHAFAHAWYKLTTRDMGPYERCVGPDVPPPQPWQFPLPAAPSKLADFDAVREKLASLASNFDTFGPLMTKLAYQSCSTYRATDKRGGCNGARIRFSPEKDWSNNAGLDKALKMLEPVKDAFGKGLSWADLIVLAGYVALESAGGKPMKFCGGRTDATDGSGSVGLELTYPKGTDTLAALRDTKKIMGLSSREMVALTGGREAVLSTSPAKVSNQWLKMKLESWIPNELILRDAEFIGIAQEFASDNEVFLEEFASAWRKLANADRWAGPGSNACEECSGPTSAAASSDDATVPDNSITTQAVIIGLVCGLLLACLVAPAMAHLWIKRQAIKEANVFSEKKKEKVEEHTSLANEALGD